jgi:hypothetical protein
MAFAAVNRPMVIRCPMKDQGAFTNVRGMAPVKQVRAAFR